MNNVKNIFETLLYKGIPKDKLRKILHVAESKESNTSAKTINYSGVEGQQSNSTLRGCALHQDNSVRQTNSCINSIFHSKKSHPAFSIDLYSNKRENNSLIEADAIPSPVNAKTLYDKSNENSFCLIVTLKNHLNKLEKHNIGTKTKSCVSLTENNPQPKIDHYGQSSDKELSLQPLNNNVVLPLNPFINVKKDGAKKSSSHKVHPLSDGETNSHYTIKKCKSFINMTNETPSKENLSDSNVLMCNINFPDDKKYKTLSSVDIISPEIPFSQQKDEIKLFSISKQEKSPNSVINTNSDNLWNEIKLRNVEIPIKYAKPVTVSQSNTHGDHIKSMTEKNTINNSTSVEEENQSQTKSKSLYKQLQSCKIYKNALMPHRESKKVDFEEVPMKSLPLTYTYHVDTDSEDVSKNMLKKMLNKIQYDDEDKHFKLHSKPSYVKSRSFRERNIWVYKNSETPSYLPTEQLIIGDKSPSPTHFKDALQSDFYQIKNKHKIKDDLDLKSNDKFISPTVNDEIDFSEYNSVNNVFSNRLSLNKKNLKLEFKRLLKLRNKLSDKRPNKNQQLRNNSFKKYCQEKAELKLNPYSNLSFPNSKSKKQKNQQPIHKSLRIAKLSDTPTTSILPNINVKSKKETVEGSFSSYCKLENNLLDIKRLNYSRGIY